MSFVISGLSPEEFRPLFGLDDAALAARGAVRKVATAKPGFPCRITLEDAEPGENLLLLHYESHRTPTPYRSSYAVYVRESAAEAARFEGEVPPVMRGRPLALRHFNEEGMLVGASLALNDDASEQINIAFENSAVAYIHVHNAAHGCFAAKVERT